MDTRILRSNGRGLVTASLSLLVALTGCGDPGSNVAAEKEKDAAALTSYSDLNSITDAGEKAAAQAFKKAGADVFVNEGSAIDVSFNSGGCDDALVANNLAKTPKLERLSLTNCKNVTDNSVETISALKELKLLSLQGTSISNAGAKKIQAAVGKDTMVMHPAIQMMQQPGGGGGPGGGGPGGGGPGGPPGP